MKNLELTQMESLRGGGGLGSSFWSGACNGAAIAGLALLAGGVTFGAGAITVLTTAGAACAFYDQMN